MRRNSTPLIKSSVGMAQDSSLSKKTFKKRPDNFDLILENESSSQIKHKDNNHKALKDKSLAPKRVSKNMRFIKAIRGAFTLSVLVFLVIFALFLSKLEFSIPRKNITKIIDISSKINICSDLDEISKKSDFAQRK